MTIQKLSIELQNAVVTDGTTITGDGTAANPLTAHLTGDGSGAALPEGGTPGQVLTRTAEGAEWGDVAGGGGTTPRGTLTRTSTGNQAALSPVGGDTGTTNYPGHYRDMTPGAALTVTGLRVAGLAPGPRVVLAIYRVDTSVLLASVEVANPAGEASGGFAAPCILAPGVAYRVGWAYVSGGTQPVTVFNQVPSYQGIAVGTKTYYGAPGSMPTDNLDNTQSSQLSFLLPAPVTVDLPPGYSAMTGDGTAVGTQLNLTRRMHVDVVDNGGNILAMAAMAPGETWAYTEA